MYKKVIVIMVLLLATLIISSCGIPEEDYNAVVTERDSANAEILQLTADLNAKNIEIENLISAIDENRDELTDMIDSLETKLKARRALWGIWEITERAGTGEISSDFLMELQLNTWIRDMPGLLDDVGDSSLSDTWDKVDSLYGSDDAAAAIDFFKYHLICIDRIDQLIDSDIKAINDKLSAQ